MHPSLCLVFAFSALAAAAQSPAATPTVAEGRSEALEHLRELAELDLAAELVPQGRELVGATGILAHSGEARGIVARALFDAGAEEEALALLDPALVAESERPWLAVQRARLLLERDDLAGAAALLRAEPGAKLPVRHPELAEAWILLARVEARSAAPGDSAALVRTARLARGFLERAPLHPEAGVAWHLLAEEALARRDGPAAASHLEKEREIDGWHEVLYVRRLQVRRNPDEPLPRLGLGQAWMQVSAFDRAREVFLELVRRQPGFARGWFHLGEALRLSNELDRAHEAYARALEIDSSLHMARYNRALVDLMRARPDEARRELEFLAGVEAAAGDPKFAGIFLHLARLDQANGAKERAAARYARYRELGGSEPLEPR